MSSLLRGAQDHNSLLQPRSLTSSNEFNSSVLLLAPSLSFQIILSILLSILILLQLGLVTSFFYHRTKRVLEFGQPSIINICNVCSVFLTSACYLYLYSSHVGCALREPIVFTCLTVMGATIAGRAWRISILFSPMMNFGRSSDGHNNALLVDSTSTSRVTERARQFLLQFIREATGRGSTLANRLQVRISIYRTMRAVSLMVLPQIILQCIMVAVPATRGRLTTVYLYQDIDSNDDGSSSSITIGRLQCQADAGQTWYIAFSILFTCIPFVMAWILNQRPKAELEKLPDMVDERSDLLKSFWVFVRVLVTSSPLIGMSMSPNAYIYATICTVLSLPLSISYFVSYTKLQSIDTNAAFKPDFTSSSDGGGRNTVAHAVRMAEMYVQIGRVQETVQLVEETLGLWRKGGVAPKNAMGFAVGGMRGDDTEEIGSGFTRSDLMSLEPEELELIIQLLKIKGKTLITLHGHQAGSAMYAKLHVDILKIFENCPASAKLKDSSIIFPVYNYLGIQIRGGAFDQDDVCSLEVDLAERFQYEAQVQSFHLARALANLADVYGRTGRCVEAFKYYEVMMSIYMQEHAARLNSTYAVDRCAVCIATSALWYLQLGKIDEAIERCDYVSMHVLPTFEESDTIGKYHTILAVIRVLKWNNHVDRARELYEQYLPDGTENHFAVGQLHKPMSLLLKICEGSSVKHSVTDSDVELALNFEINDFSDNIMMSDGWSMNSMGAEVCLHLARRLKPGEIVREELVKKGIHLSSIADTRVKSSNGLIKHILAFEAHQAVFLDLLGLAGLDAKTPRKNVYDLSLDVRRTARRSSTLMGKNSEVNSGTDRDIAKRLVFKEEPEGAAVTVLGSSSGESRAGSFEKSRKPKQTLISTRLNFRDSSSASPKLSGSGISYGSADSSKGNAAGGARVRPSSRIS